MPRDGELRGACVDFESSDPVGACVDFGSSEPVGAFVDFQPDRVHLKYDGTLPGEAELGSAGVQPNKG